MRINKEVLETLNKACNLALTTSVSDIEKSKIKEVADFITSKLYEMSLTNQKYIYVSGRGS